MIIRVALTSSGRVGQVTFLSSSRTARGKPLSGGTHPISLLDRVLTAAVHVYLDSLCSLCESQLGAILPPLHPLRVLPLVLIGKEVAVFALGAFENDFVSGISFSREVGSESDSAPTRSAISGSW